MDKKYIKTFINLSNPLSDLCVSEIRSPWAVPNERCKATRRQKTEKTKDDYRSHFYHDIGRIIYSKSFRRLKHKTQVFISHEGDHFRI